MLLLSSLLSLLSLLRLRRAPAASEDIVTCKAAAFAAYPPAANKCSRRSHPIIDRGAHGARDATCSCCRPVKALATSRAQSIKYINVRRHIIGRTTRRCVLLPSANTYLRERCDEAIKAAAVALLLSSLLPTLSLVSVRRGGSFRTGAPEHYHICLRPLEVLAGASGATTRGPTVWAATGRTGIEARRWLRLNCRQRAAAERTEVHSSALSLWRLKKNIRSALNSRLVALAPPARSQMDQCHCVALRRPDT